MSRQVRDLQPVDARGRKYLAADERRRFLEVAARALRPADQTFALTLAHNGARVSEALAIWRHRMICSLDYPKEERTGRFGFM